MKYALALVISFTACRTTSPQGGPSEVAAYATADVGSWRWPKQDIAVCWETPEVSQLRSTNVAAPKAGEVEAFKTKVQQLVQLNYRKAGIEFSGWTVCQDKQPGIHVLVNGQTTQTRDFGRALDGVYAGVMLMYPAAAHEFALTGAVHEFGHALGLRHEASRVEGRTYCKDFFGNEHGEPFAFSMGRYDPQSIMNYCIFDGVAPADDEKIAQLSDHDVVALKEIYGGVVAELVTPLPFVIGASHYAVGVKGMDKYRYKYGPYATTSCQDSADYKAVAGSDAIIIERGDWPKGEYKLCLIGNKGALWQKPVAASEYYWRYTNAKVFADYELSAGDFIGAAVERGLAQANSTGRIAKVEYKIFPITGETSSEPACSSATDYLELDNPKKLAFSVPENATFGLVKVCLLATDTSGVRQAPVDANIRYFYYKNPRFLRPLFVPQAATDPNLAQIAKDDKVTAVLVGTEFQNLDELDYWLGPQAGECGEWIKSDVQAPIRFDQSTMKDVMLCLRVHQQGGAFIDLPTLKWTR